MESAVVILGGEGSGKTALALRYVQGTYTEIYDPHVVEEYRMQDTVDGETLVLKISDVCGSTDFITVRDDVCVKADGYMYVIDANSDGSLEAVKDIRQAVTSGVGDKPSVLVATKCDSDDLDVLEEARDLAAAWQVPLIECSSKLSFGVSEAFHHIARLLNPSLSQGARKNWDESIITDKTGSKHEADPSNEQMPLCEASLLLSSASPERVEIKRVHSTSTCSSEAPPTKGTSRSTTSKQLNQSLGLRNKAHSEPEPHATDYFSTELSAYGSEVSLHGQTVGDEGSLWQPLLSCNRSVYTNEQVNFDKAGDNSALITHRGTRRSMMMAPLALGPAASLPLPPLSTKQPVDQRHEARTPLSQQSRLESFGAKEDKIDKPREPWYRRLLCCSN